MHPVATFDQNLKHSTVWIFPDASLSRSIKHAGRKAVKAMRTSSGKVVIKKARTRKSGSLEKQPKFLRSMIRVGSDCSGLGTEILAFNGIPALTERVVHVFASEIDVAVAAIFNASHNVNKSTAM
jgi:hypothetical protein